MSAPRISCRSALGKVTIHSFPPGIPTRKKYSFACSLLSIYNKCAPIHTHGSAVPGTSHTHETTAQDKIGQPWPTWDGTCRRRSPWSLRNQPDRRTNRRAKVSARSNTPTVGALTPPTGRWGECLLCSGAHSRRQRNRFVHRDLFFHAIRSGTETKTRCRQPETIDWSSFNRPFSGETLPATAVGIQNGATFAP